MSTSVLLIDPDPAGYHALSDRLRADGCDVQAATDLAIAVEICTDAAPDVVLLGLDFPELDSLEFLDRLRALKGLEYTPILAHSASDDYGLAVSALDRGAADHLRKSGDVNELAARVGAARRQRELIERLEVRNAQLERFAMLDQLTGLANRYSAEEALGKEALAAQRYGQPFAVVLADVDHFKSINDAHGHAAGDLVLCAVADSLRDQVRGVDLVGRWGGEEFLIVLPQTDGPGACKVGERLRAGIRREKVTYGGSEIRFSASFGCAAFDGGDPFELIERADKRLYEAKAGGRDAVRG
jgi:two-component system, cell cycle response regulator